MCSYVMVMVDMVLPCEMPECHGKKPKKCTGNFSLLCMLLVYDRRDHTAWTCEFNKLENANNIKFHPFRNNCTSHITNKLFFISWNLRVRVRLLKLSMGIENEQDSFVLSFSCQHYSGKMLFVPLSSFSWYRIIVMTYEIQVFPF